MTCGEQACQREWHRRKCAKWNRENSELLKRERLVHQLKAVTAGRGQAKVTDDAHPSTAPLQNAPRTEHLSPFAQEVIAAQLAVMIEYLLRHVLRRAQAVMRRQVTVNTG